MESPGVATSTKERMAGMYLLRHNILQRQIYEISQSTQVRSRIRIEKTTSMLSATRMANRFGINGNGKDTSLTVATIAEGEEFLTTNALRDMFQLFAQEITLNIHRLANIPQYNPLRVFL